ncbi:invasion associated locus B family protein [Chachezhania sediminis]|uniref:invasion associated locus B family protein n=1 Tax=Chachezhania sediminis TaxID=2599291 RepID=UPI003898E949
MQFLVTGTNERRWGLKAVIAAVGLAGALAQPAVAQSTTDNRVAAETDWSVFVEDNPKECWSASAPKETVNTRDGRVVPVRRGDILLMVFFRPDAGVKGQVTFTGGYPFARGSNVSLQIGDSTFNLFTDGEWAWPTSEGEDAKIVAAMKAGATAVLTARSTRGTQTKDTFSLSGFTAATEDAQKRCGG